VRVTQPGEVAFFIKNASNILEECKTVLMAYKPYLDFTRDMDQINRSLLEERKPISSN
jgi:hypothetical protein